MHSLDQERISHRGWWLLILFPFHNDLESFRFCPFPQRLILVEHLVSNVKSLAYCNRFLRRTQVCFMGYYYWHLQLIGSYWFVLRGTEIRQHWIQTKFSQITNDHQAWLNILSSWQTWLWYWLDDDWRILFFSLWLCNLFQ